MTFRSPAQDPEISPPLFSAEQALSCAEAEVVLQNLASVFFQNSSDRSLASVQEAHGETSKEASLPSPETRYRALVEQIPAVVFMAYLDRGIGEAYVSPQIEAVLGFRQEEWLEDPVRWFHQIHPDDKVRWSVEAAEMFLSGQPLRSAYRVMARDGRVICFHCEAKMIRHEDGRPWFIHGVAFDITDLKQAEQALQEERNVLSTILDTVGALVLVLDGKGRIVRFNRACEQTTGYSSEEVVGKHVWDLFPGSEEIERFRLTFEELRSGRLAGEYEAYWLRRDGSRRLIAWSGTMIPGNGGTPAYIIATGIDVTDRKRLEKAILDISDREQRRIGQDLHDGLGQHLTGIAFISKVQEQKLAEKGLPEAADAEKIVTLVNEAIHKTRELAKGLLPVVSEARGLMSALEQYAAEVRDVFRFACRFQCSELVLIHDDAMATHLYHIAREAVSNAIRHSRPRHITINLSSHGGRGTLEVKDDGTGIAPAPANSPGLGLHIMRYRARMIGGTLDIHPGAPRGTIVRCSFPIR